MTQDVYLEDFLTRRQNDGCPELDAFGLQIETVGKHRVDTQTMAVGPVSQALLLGALLIRFCATLRAGLLSSAGSSRFADFQRRSSS